MMILCSAEDMVYNIPNAAQIQNLRGTETLIFGPKRDYTGY